MRPAHLRVCRACHSAFRVRRRVGYGVFCLVLGGAALALGLASRAHPIGILLMPIGIGIVVVGVGALRASHTCAICQSRDTSPMGPDGKALHGAA